MSSGGIQCVSILCSILLGVTLGLSCTVVGSPYWIRHDGSDANIKDIHVGLWQFCDTLTGGNENCELTWDRQNIKDSGKCLGVNSWLVHSVGPCGC